MSLAFSAAAAPGPKVRAPNPRDWTNARIARLGFLVGLGWDANRIARDSIINSNRKNVVQQVHRIGLSFHTAAELSLDLSSDIYIRFDEAALKRGIQREGLARLLLRECASDPNLIDNVLDDGA